MAIKKFQLQPNKNEKIYNVTSLYNDIPVNNETSFYKIKNFTKDTLVDKNAIFQSLSNIFSWNKNERLLDPNFGNELKTFLYEELNSLNSNKIIAHIREIINIYEPRIVIDNIYNIEDVVQNSPELYMMTTEHSAVGIILQFHIIGIENEQFEYIINN